MPPLRAIDDPPPALAVLPKTNGAGDLERDAELEIMRLASLLVSAHDRDDAASVREMVHRIRVLLVMLASARD